MGKLPAIWAGILGDCGVTTMIMAIGPDETARPSHLARSMLIIMDAGVAGDP